MILYRIRWIKHWETGKPMDHESFYYTSLPDINEAYRKQNWATEHWPNGECVVEEYEK